METWTYPARVERLAGDEGAEEYLVRFPDLPEALTGAASRAEALTLAEDALEETVLGYMADGRDIPRPRKAGAGEVAVPLDVVTAARAALAIRMREQKVGKSELARRLGQTEYTIRRLVDGSSGVKIGTVQKALRALGVRSAFQTQDAA